jgi:hypothetical protein
VSDSWRGLRLDLERELRRSRPQPSWDFIRALTLELGGRHGRRGSWRLAFVAGLTVVMLGAIASMGGIGKAATAVKSVVNTVSGGGGVTVIHRSPAHDQYHCNSGRGNLSETDSGTGQTDSSTLVNPHTGGTGPGTSPTDDCDPGNSGAHNRGGD